MLAVIKKSVAVLVFAVFALCAFAQEAKQAAPDPSALKQFTRSGKFNGITLYFVLMNNKTVEALFQPPTMYAMRARANMATMLYVQGTPDKDGSLNTDFTLEQDGLSQTGTAHNIKNFAAGSVAKGERIDGILQFEKKIDPSHAFVVKNTEGAVEFQLTPEALKLLEPPPAQPQQK
jgi:hypothetical protein